jgi:putative MATE family efflux protein
LVPQERVRRILNLALPVIAGMVSQNVLNLVDTAMVSRLDHSDAALAAVGYGGFILFVAQSIILGLSTGVLAMAARRKGEGRPGETAWFLNAALLIIAVAAPAISVLVFFLIPRVYPLINDDPAVMALGIPYLQMRAAGIIFVAMNFSFRGYWNAIDMTRLYMFTLILMHSMNIFLNWVFIFGNLGAPAMGVQGAGLASVCALCFGSSLYFLFGMRWAREFGFLKRLPPREDILRLVRISLPSGVHQIFFSAGWLGLFWIIGQVGTAEVAAGNVLVNVMLVAWLPGMGLGLAASTLVGQALGRRDTEEAARWGWDVVKIAAVGLTVAGLPMVLVPAQLLSAIYTLDPRTLELALWPLRLIGLSMIFEAVGTILQNALLGAGDSRRVMKIAIVGQWGVFMPLAYLVGPVLGLGLSGIWACQILYRIAQAGVFGLLWVRRDWARLAI